MRPHWDDERVFDGIRMYEAAVDAGSHVRSLAGSPEGPVGVAWAPVGLGDIPPLDHCRVVELAGPDGATLFFVPLTILGGVLREAGIMRGLDPANDERFVALRSLEPGATEPAVHGLFELIYLLARYPGGLNT